MHKKNSGLLPIILFASVALIILVGLGDALMPLLVALFMAYLLFPLVKRLESKGVKKEIAVSLALALGVAFWATAILLLVPPLVEDLRDLIQAMPRITETAIHKVEEIATRYDIELPLNREDLIAQAKLYLSDLPMETIKSVGAIFGKAFSGIVGLFLLVLNLLLIPIFFFYLIADYERIMDGMREMVPPRHRRWFESFLRRSNQIISAYFRGQLLVALILGALYGFGFWAAGLRFGFIIGLITGFLNVIPYAGPLIGLGVATTVSLANYEGIGSILSVVGVFAVVQGLEGFVITPKIVGDRVGLNAFETMIVLIVGGNLGGFVGMLVAIPLGGIAKFLLTESVARYRKSAIYR